MPYKDKEKKKEYNRRYRIAHREKIDAWNKQYHQERRVYFNNLQNIRMRNRKKDGICQDCKQLRSANSVYCLFHLIQARRSKKRSLRNERNREKANERSRVRYYKLKEANKCVECGMPLNEESRRGIRCINCYNLISKVNY